MEAPSFVQARAVYQQGVLKLLDALQLPEGTRVRVTIQAVSSDAPPGKLTFPTRLVPAQALDRFTALVALGGDALADSEALYDADSH
ncbi:MAG: antitoxin family protein [Anaerolineae bacterium]|nr:antitoxin family protein [Anaerolineae bacterium]